MDTLGTFNFFSLGNGRNASVGPKLLQPAGTVITRPGVDGAAAIEYGIPAGKPFNMTGSVDLLNIPAAVNLHGLYRAIVRITPMKLVWQNVNFDTYNTRFLILDVGPPDIKTPAVQCGGITPNSKVWMVTQFQLQAVPI